MIEVAVKKYLSGENGPFCLDLTFSLEKNDFMVIHGKSGSGKTSTLKIIAGLLNPDAGTLMVHKKIWWDINTNLSPQKRTIGYLGQKPNLFPHMTVLKNITYGIRNKSSANNLVNELLTVMELEELTQCRPKKLSGGQQQRVALARTLVQKPTILLLDEPFSALDITMKTKLIGYLKQKTTEWQATTILVSHDPFSFDSTATHTYDLVNGRMESFKLKNTVSMNGEIIAIAENKGDLSLTVRIGGSEIILPKKPIEHLDLKVGDQIMIEGQFLNPKISS